MATKMTKEEAINKVRQMSLPKETMEILQALAPELAESEDERIRRKMLEHFRSKTKETWCNIPVKDIIAYLEKQKEPEHICDSYQFEEGFKTGLEIGLRKQKENPKSADSIPSDCTSDAKCENRWHKVIDSLPDNGRLVLAKDCLGNVLLARYDGENWEVNVYDNEDHYCHNSISKWCEIPSEKQKEQNLIMANSPQLKEQKPVEWSKDIIRKAVKEVGLTQHQIDWFKTNVFPPKQEWSEEDKKTIDDAYCWLCEYAGSLIQRNYGKSSMLYGIANKLKSLHSQPKQEWSEEDEANRTFILESLEDQIRFCKKDAKGAYYTKQIRTAQNWLKSLSLNLKKKNEDVAKLCSNE